MVVHPLSLSANFFSAVSESVDRPDLKKLSIVHNLDWVLRQQHAILGVVIGSLREAGKCCLSLVEGIFLMSSIEKNNGRTWWSSAHNG